jgi:hypothetical protein
MVLSLLIAWSLTLITDQRRRWQYVLGLVAIILIGNAFYFRPQSYLVNADDYYYTDASRIRTQMSGILPDYIPKQMSEDLTPPEALFLVPAGIEEQVEVLVDRGHERLLKTSLLSPIKLHFTIADFPGWQVEIDGQPVEKRGGENGGIAVEVPAGEHLIGAYFGATPVRYWSDVISGLSLVVLLLVAVRLQSDLPSHLVPEPISTKPTTRPTPARTKKRKPSS